MTFKIHRIIPILLAVVFVCVTSCERTIIKVEETETEKMTEVSETEKTETEGVTVVPETEEMTEEPETTAFDDPYDITAEELYRAIRNDEIPYDDAVKYPAFRAEVEQMFSEVLGHPIAWEDLSFAIEDHDEMFHYSFWIRDSEEYITFLQCVVLSWMDSDDSILYSLYWSELYPVYGSYKHGDGIIGTMPHCFNKTMLETQLTQNFDMSVHTAIYEGIRYADHHIFVPMIHDEMIVYADILVDADLQYQLFTAETIDLTALSPYDFLVTYQTFGLKPQDLMEYFPNHPLNPRYAISGYMGVDDILQSEYRMYSGFDTQPYIRVKDDGQTDVSFGLSLPQTPAGEVLEIADLTEDTTYQDLAWVVWSER